MHWVNKFFIAAAMVGCITAGQVCRAADPVYVADMNKFYDLQKKDPAAALDLMLQLARKYPNDKTIQLAAGYQLLAKKETELALPYFQASYKLDPGDIQTVMQLGYLLDQLGHHREAMQYFRIAMNSKADAKVRDTASQSLQNLAGQQTRQLPDPQFVELMFSPIYMDRFENTIFPISLKVGTKMAGAKNTDVYLSVKSNKDSRSGIGAIPRIFNDNSLVLAVGVRNQPFENIPITLYAEAGTAFKYLDNAYESRWQEDYRLGMFYFKGFEPGFKITQLKAFQPMGDFNMDVSYYSRYDNNVIGYGRARAGLRVVNTPTSYADLYGLASLSFDTNNEYYNNNVITGVGLAFRPDRFTPLTVHAEYLWGNYIGGERPTDMPKSYEDMQVGMDWFMRF